jgi:hypothetical protein
MINTDSLFTLLQKPAYNELGPQSSSPYTPKNKSLKRVRKQDLDDLGISGSPLKNMMQTEYGGSPRSLKIVDWKKGKDITAGRNAAIVIFRHPGTGELGYTIAATDGPPGAPHAELRALDALPEAVKRSKENILQVYTERKPCQEGSDCNRKLKLAIGENTEIIYGAHHTPHKGRREESEFALQVKQHDLGVRVANPEFKKKLRFCGLE